MTNGKGTTDSKHSHPIAQNVLAQNVLARNFNAVAGSFFATIKGEVIDHEDYQRRTAAIAAIGDYIDSFYNPCRRHSAFGYVSPIEFELKFLNEKIDQLAASADCPPYRGNSSRPAESLSQRGPSRTRANAH